MFAMEMADHYGGFYMFAQHPYLWQNHPKPKKDQPETSENNRARNDSESESHHHDDKKRVSFSDEKNHEQEHHDSKPRRFSWTWIRNKAGSKKSDSKRDDVVDIHF